MAVAGRAAGALRSANRTASPNPSGASGRRAHGSGGSSSRWPTPICSMPRPANGGLPRDAGVDETAERVDVRARGRLVATDELGREVVDRPQHLAGQREHRVVLALGQPEVGQPRDAVDVEQDVRGLDVAVNDSGAVQGVESRRHVGGDAHDVVERKRPLGVDALGDGDAGHELEREVVLAVGLARVEQADEVAVLDRARRARLAQQAADQSLVAREGRFEQLQSDDVAGLPVRRAEHLAHAALAQDRLDAVWPDGVADPSHLSRITVPGLTAGATRSIVEWCGVLASHG